MLKGHLEFFKGPGWYYKARLDLDGFMKACINMHNLIIEDEHGYNVEVSSNHDEVQTMSKEWPIVKFVCGTNEIENTDMFHNLRGDLIAHLW